MKRRLFLTGPSGCGKSTLLRRVLGERMSFAGGFITDRVCDSTGRYQYFYMQRADGSGPKSIFLDLRQNPPARNDLVFTDLVPQILQERSSFSVLDEIGGMELLLPEFRSALEVFLSSETPCIGVLKGSKNSQALRKTARLPESYQAHFLQLHQMLSSDPNTLLVEMSAWNDNNAEHQVQKWVEIYGHG